MTFLRSQLRNVVHYLFQKSKVLCNTLLFFLSNNSNIGHSWLSHHVPVPMFLRVELQVAGLQSAGVRALLNWYVWNTEIMLKLHCFHLGNQGNRTRTSLIHRLDIFVETSLYNFDSKGWSSTDSLLRYCSLVSTSLSWLILIYCTYIYCFCLFLLLDFIYCFSSFSIIYFHIQVVKRKVYVTPIRRQIKHNCCLDH